MTGVVAAIGIAVMLAWMYSRAQARERDTAEIAVAGEMHGLATISLPRRYRSLGLAGGDRSLSHAEQLARHDENLPLMFRFTRDPSNDWGGYARDPEMLNVVLLPPAALEAPDAALRKFSIERYYSPAGDTIPLDSSRWQEGHDAKYRWRLLDMNDHFGVDHEPRWALAMLDATRGVRLDLFVWQRRMKQAEALAMLKGLLDTLQLKPALAEHFAQTGGVQARLDRLRESNLQAMFATLARLSVAAPSEGRTSFAPGVAVWLDEDRKAVRVLRVLASVPLPLGASKADRDGQGRPRLPLVLTPGQYPGPTMDSLPSLDLQMLYWTPALERWQRSGLQRATMDEEHPLLPFEDAVVARLEQTPGARDAVHIILGEHWFHPPALDDTRRVGALLDECDRWQSELLAGRIVGGEVKAPMLR